MNNTSHYTQKIYEEFEEIKSFLLNDEAFMFDELSQKIKDISIIFADSEDKSYSALAVYKDNCVVFNKFYLESKRRTIIHELSHHLVYHSKIQGTSGAHCLEFAIVNHVLQRKYSVSFHDYRHCYFNSYDIHEDIAYSSLKVNSSQYDNLIRSIEYLNLNDLCGQAKKYAQKIRKRSL